MIKLMKHYVTDGVLKARVFYSRYNVNGRDAITIFHKDYTREFGVIFAKHPGYRNDTDSMADYFDQGSVTIFADSPLWEQAVARLSDKR